MCDGTRCPNEIIMYTQHTDTVVVAAPPATPVQNFRNINRAMAVRWCSMVKAKSINFNKLQFYEIDDTIRPNEP